jgi:aryl-alcohol dehydrogenase-like predicted oxidoreductase
MELCLGTAQIGLAYGIRKAKVPFDDVMMIMKHAYKHGIHFLDTAAAYGTAECVIGNIMQQAGLHYNIVTKFNYPEGWQQGKLYSNLCSSLDSLKQSSINGYLLHQASYMNHMEVMQELCDCKRKGLVEKIGVSIYTPSEAINAIHINAIDYIQVPYNIIDTRLDRADFFTKAHQNGKTVFARSLLLQGILLMKKDELPLSISKKAWPVINLVQEEAVKHGVSILNYLFSFAKTNSNIDFLVIGVENYQQYLEIYDNFLKSNPDNYDFSALRRKFYCVSDIILNPSLWR